MAVANCGSSVTSPELRVRASHKSARVVGGEAGSFGEDERFGVVDQGEADRHAIEHSDATTRASR